MRSAALVAVLLVGCTTSGPPSVANPSGSAFPAEATESVPRVMPSGSLEATTLRTPPVTPTASPRQTPISARTPAQNDAVAESDTFWRVWVQTPHGEPAFNAGSLAENLRQADLVVRGRITDVYVGEYWDGWEPIVYATVALDEVLKGEPLSRTPGFVEVGLGILYDESLLERLPTPTHDNVWFLLHEESRWPRERPNKSDIAPFAYLRVNEQQGVLRNIDGRVKAVEPYWIERALGPDHFPLPLEDADYSELVEKLRDVAQTR